MNDSILTVIADNPALMEAVKKVVLEHFEMPFSEVLSDEQLGQIARARISGRTAVEAAFTQIALYKSVPELSSKRNEAR